MHRSVQRGEHRHGYLGADNAERTARHMAPFAWDRLLSQRATGWARTLLATGQFKHQDLSSIANAAGGRY
jgi:uncharacterized protein YkwD